MKYLVLYERHGELFYRYRNSKPQYEIGSYTSMGWKLVDIKYLKSGKVLNEYNYSTTLQVKSRVVNLIEKLDIRRIAEFIALVIVLKYFM